MAAYGQKKDDVYGAEVFYRELGYYITRREAYERALKYFDETLARNPTDKRALMGRSRARAKECQYQGALDDIAKALQQDPEDLVLAAQRALNTYLCCEFEDALVMNERMVPKRKKPDNFTMGVMHCTQSIENGVGVRAGHPLRDYFKIVRKLGWKKFREAEKPFEPKSKYKKKKKSKSKMVKKKPVREPVVPKIRSRPSRYMKAKNSAFSTTSPSTSAAAKSEAEEVEITSENLDTKSAVSGTPEARIDAYEVNETEDLYIRDSVHSQKTESDYVPPFKKPYPFRPLQRYTTNIENYMSEKYLDSLYLDKIFLKNLNRHLGVPSPNKKGSNRIIQMSRDGHKMLAYKQELLRTRRPFYFIKYQEARISGALKARMDAELQKVQNAAKKDADSLLLKIRKAIYGKQTQAALEAAEKLKVFCDVKSKKILPMQGEYLEEIYRLVCLAHYQLFRLNDTQCEWDREKRIHKWFGVTLSREPSTDSVLDQFKGVFTDWKKQITIYEERLRKATSCEEMAWLYHELSRFHSELKQFELARVYARKCIAEGRDANDLHWILNAMMMLTRINMQQHNRNDAKVQLHHALLVANQIGDPVVEEYIEKCLEVVDKVEFGDYFGAKVLEKREQQIVKIMPGAEMKDEVAYLFRKMAVMPATRRMSVMPGVRLEDTGEKSAAANKMSIMPGTKSPEEQTATPHMLGGSSKKSPKGDSPEGKGVGFMELIKYHVE